MTLREAVDRLRNAGGLDSFYVTGGGPGTGECVGVEPSACGWSLYYSERGRKSPMRTGLDEAAAANALLQAVDRMMRDSGRPGVPGV